MALTRATRPTSSAVLDWCADAGAAAIPFGGGTSVVGGVEPRVAGEAAGASRSTCGRLDRVLEVDAVSRAARIQARRHRARRSRSSCKAHGLTLRHYPQSFEYSTLGGWIATRAGGHFATLQTHIDDFVESVRALTPQRRLGEPPPAGLGRRAQPGPDADRLGGDPRRDHRGLGAGAGGAALQGLGRCAVRRLRATGRDAVRALAQSGLHPSNCRLLDPGEAALTGAAPGRAARCSCSASSRPTTPLERLDGPRRWSCAATTAASCRRRAGERRGEGAWRDAFLRAPYLRDTLVAAGILAETFETAITWDRFDAFVAEVRERARGGARAGGRA